MRVLIFVRSLAVGGTERQVPLLANGLAARGHSVMVAQLYSGGAMEASLRDGSVRLVSLDKTSRWDVVGPLRRLWRLFRDERLDVIYSFLPMQNVLAALLQPSEKDTRLVFGARASGMKLAHYDRLSALSYRAEALLSGSADVIVANADRFRHDAAARGFRNARIVVIPNGIDTEAMHFEAAARERLRRAWNVKKGAFLIGIVARLDPMKDHSNFLEAAAKFVEKNSDARFVCVGGGAAGDYAAALKQRAQVLGLGERVIFTGEQKDMAGVYSGFDIATLTSAFGEGFPNVVGEAMACGVPVVATDVGEARRIVSDFGVVVPPRRPDLLCAAWTDLRQRLTRDAGLRAAARAHIVKNFGVEAMVARTEAVLSEACAGAAPR